MKKIIIALISIFVFGLTQCITSAQDLDINFIAYVNRVENKVKSNWVIPHGKIDKKAVMVFDIDKNGEISNISLTTPSGDKEFDDTALTAVSASIPLEMLPETIKSDKIKIQIAFKQNDIEASTISEALCTNETKQNIYENYSPPLSESDTPIIKENNIKTAKVKKTYIKTKKVYPHYCPQSYNAGIRPKTVAAATVSLLIWPGLGQLINGEPLEKAGTHAVLGIINVFRIWSFYDALVDRKGGFCDDRL